MANSWVENQKLMDSLYEKDFGNKEVQSKKENKEKGSITFGLVMLPFLFIELLIRTFITEPKSNWNPKVHFFIGITKFFTYAFVLYSTMDIKSFIESNIESKGIVTLMMAFIVIFSMIQAFYGVFVAGGGASSEEFRLDKRGGVVYMGSISGHDFSTPKGNEEIDGTFKYMNAKMGGMSNRQKEKYLGDFYGGKQ